MKRTEDSLQQSVIRYCKHRYPNVIIYHVPNGGKKKTKVSQSGKVYSPEGSRLKSMGVTPGIPDLFIAQTTSLFGGLYLELKSETGELSKSQKSIIPRLRESGYRVEVVNCIDDAIKVIDSYLK